VASEQATFVGLILLMVVGLSAFSAALGGCSFNPCDLAAAWARGTVGGGQLLLRSAAQSAGAVAGAHAALRLLPAAWARHGRALVAVTAPGMGLSQGAGCEFVLTLLLTFCVLVALDLRSGLLRTALPLLGTAAALYAGATFSGPVLNPAAALGWSAVHWPDARGYLVEHVAVYWGAPLAAAVLATWAHAGMQASRRTPARGKED
jgi:glycerol uptake facilitator-like aquaporin